MSSANDPELNARSVSSRSEPPQSLFDATLAATSNPAHLTVSALPLELRQLSLGRAEDAAVALLLLKCPLRVPRTLPPTSPPLPRYIDLYVAMSALQKAIRIGNTTLAVNRRANGTPFGA